MFHYALNGFLMISVPIVGFELDIRQKQQEEFFPSHLEIHISKVKNERKRLKSTIRCKVSGYIQL